MKSKETIGLILIIALFIISAYYSNLYKTDLQFLLTDYTYFGAVIYVLIVIFACVIAPINAVPLLPVASALWGPVNAAILSIIAWVLGSILIYWLLQKYGRPIVARFIDLKKYDNKHINLPEKNKFWILVGLRMVTPVDVLSYVLGLFVPMSWRLYISTTIIGVTPFAFIFAYAATLPPIYQFFTGIVGVAILLWGVFSLKKFYGEKSGEKMEI